MPYQPDPNNRRRFRDDATGIRFVLGDSTNEEGAYLSPSERAVTIYYSDEVLGGIVRETRNDVRSSAAPAGTDGGPDDSAAGSGRGRSSPHDAFAGGGAPRLVTAGRAASRSYRGRSSPGAPYRAARGAPSELSK